MWNFGGHCFWPDYVASLARMLELFAGSFGIDSRRSYWSGEIVSTIIIIDTFSFQHQNDFLIFAFGCLDNFFFSGWPYCFPIKYITSQGHWYLTQIDPPPPELTELRYGSSTLILYKELSSTIFQSCQSVCQASVTPVQISTFCNI